MTDSTHQDFSHHHTIFNKTHNDSEADCFHPQ